MRIGEFAKLAELPVDTICYYERMQLLPKPPRTASGYRVYNRSALERSRFIKMTQDLGFALKEIRELLELHATMAALPAGKFIRSAELSSMIRMAASKRVQIDAKISSLRRLRRKISDFITALEQTPEPICPGSQPRAATRAGQVAVTRPKGTCPASGRGGSSRP
jgi:MerR family copper efflux transcriptional regulator